MTQYTYAQLEGLWINNGGSTSLAPLMAAIALAESGGDSSALDNNPSTGDYSVGLWQINYYDGLLSSRTAQFGSPSSLQSNPNAQAAAAVAIEQEQGLSAWTTYTSGAYQAYMNAGTTPDTSVGGTSTGTAQGTDAGLFQPEALPSTCLIGMPGFDLGVGSTPDICFVQKSWLRGLLGGLLIGAGGITGLIALNLLFKSGFGVSLPGGDKAQGAAQSVYRKVRPGEGGPAEDLQAREDKELGSKTLKTGAKPAAAPIAPKQVTPAKQGSGITKKVGLPSAATKQIGPGSAKKTSTAAKASKGAAKTGGSMKLGQAIKSLPEIVAE